MKNCAAIIVTGVLAAFLAFPGAIIAESDILPPAETVCMECPVPEITPVPSETTPVPTAEPLTEEDFVFEYGSITAALGDSPDALVEEISISDDCAMQVDEDYHNPFVREAKAYNGKEITVQSGQGASATESITGIYVDTEEIKTRRGIGVGSTLSQVLRVYGDSCSRYLDTIIYVDGNRRLLVFQIDGNKVISYAILQDKDPSSRSGK